MPRLLSYHRNDLTPVIFQVENEEEAVKVINQAELPEDNNWKWTLDGWDFDPIEGTIVTACCGKRINEWGFCSGCREYCGKV